MGWRKYHKRKKPTRPRTYLCRNGHLKIGSNLVVKNDYRGPDWKYYGCKICINACYARHKEKRNG